MTSLLMKPTSAGKDTRHKRDQPLKKLAYVSNHWGPLLTERGLDSFLFVILKRYLLDLLQEAISKRTFILIIVFTFYFS
ncbi:hypothetical protein CU052_17360 [Vibrio harveyi]|nr:hypothetical protein CU052_17360 [Vibrio harveyi]